MLFDIKLWVKNERNKYIPFIIFFICIILNTNLTLNQFGINPGVTDYLLVMFRGSEELEMKIPAAYLCFNIYITWVIGYYFFKDWNSYGNLIMIKQKRKNIWWINKCIWCIFTIISFYVLAYVVFFAWDFISKIGMGSLDLKSFNINEMNLFRLNIESCKILLTEDINIEQIKCIGNMEFFIMCFVTPIIVSIGISILQMTISLIIEPVYSQIIVIALFVISACYSNKFLIGNYLMLLRNENISINGNLNFYMGIMLGTLMAVIGIVAGMFIMKRKDIY